MFDPVIRASRAFYRIFGALPYSVRALFYLAVVLLFVAVLYRIFD